MWLVVGLGNPGSDYRGTRHNLGAETVAELARTLGLSLAPGKGDYYWARARGGGEPLALGCPTTYMNLSGPAVSQLMKHSGAAPSELIVVVDDFCLPLGRLRMRPRGGDGGHRGLASVIEELGSEDFCRLRMGVGEPPPGEDPADWVLTSFATEDGPTVKEMQERAVEALVLLRRERLLRVMDRANRWLDPDEAGEVRSS